LRGSTEETKHFRYVYRMHKTTYNYSKKLLCIEEGGESRENEVYVSVKVSEGRTEAQHKDRE
jgi:hypothetical protein